MDSTKQTDDKIDVYQLVTNNIIACLEKGVIPWQQPWTDAGMPCNLLSKRPYRGINLWMLASLNYEQNLFLTWDQIKELGGSVNKGEHGHIVVFWKAAQKKGEVQQDDKQKHVPLLRYYKVFNIAQCRELPVHLTPVKDDTAECDPLVECENIIHTMPDAPKIVHKEPAAFYHIPTDVVNMPKKKNFNSIHGYYATLFHELVHSTGAEKRLGRKSLEDMAPFGSVSYAMEELIAEMGTSFLCQYSGILPIQLESSAAYIENWLKVFKGDKRFLISAGGQAQKAVDFILNKKDSVPDTETDESSKESIVC